jgi:NAD+ diphosphatase
VGPISLAHVSTDDIKACLGPEPFFGQGQIEGELIQLDLHKSPRESTSAVEAARHRGPPVVFLGLRQLSPDTTAALPSSDFKDPQAAVANLEGTPFFSLDVAELTKDQIEELTKSCAKEGEVLTWADPRAPMAAFDQSAAGIFAVARSLLDWNSRNKVSCSCEGRNRPV